VLDLVPTVAKLYFSTNTLPPGSFTLSPVQAALLTGVGFQHKPVEVLAQELNLQVNQVLPMFNKAIKKFHSMCQLSYEKEVGLELLKEEEQAQAVME